MLRIAIDEKDGSATSLRLEGALIGAWVDELRRVCDLALAGRARLTLDLAGVSFVGRDGILLLTGLRGRGVALVSCTALVAEQLKAHAEINGSRG